MKPFLVKAETVRLKKLNIKTLSYIQNTSGY